MIDIKRQFLEENLTLWRSKTFYKLSLFSIYSIKVFILYLSQNDKNSSRILIDAIYTMFFYNIYKAFLLLEVLKINGFIRIQQDNIWTNYLLIQLAV